MKQRIEWVDIAKCIGIFLVIFGHVGNEGLFNQFLYVFHMPLFFILSGFFASENKMAWKLFFQKNVKALIIPYIFLYIIGTPIGIVSIIRHPELYPSIQTTHLLWKPFLGMIFGCDNCFPNVSFIMTNGPLWFLLNIFLIRLFFQLTLRSSWSYKFLISCIISIGSYYIVKNYAWANIWHLKTALLCYSYYLLGFILNHRYRFSDYLIAGKPYYKIIITVFCFTILFFSLPYTGSLIRYVGPEIQCNIIYAAILAIIGSLGVFCLSTFFPFKSIFVKIGKESLIIMGIHLTILAFVKIVLLKLGFPALNYTFIICCIESILTLFASSFVAKIMIKYIPSLIGYQKK